MDDFANDDFIRRVVYDDLAALVLDVEGTPGEEYLTIELMDVEKAESQRRKHALVIEFPVSLSAEIHEATLQLAVYLAIRIDRFLRNRKANASRSAEARKASARKAVQTRWAKAKGAKFEG